MPMMVFDHRHCRWRPWHGSRAAWLKLPHAVATGLCLLGTAALPASAPLPPRPASGHAAPVVAERAGPAMAIFLPSPWLGETGITAGGPSAGGPPMLLGGGGGGSGPPAPPPGTAPQPPIVTVTTALPPAPPRTPVPEPGSAPVLAIATLALIGLRRRGRHSAAPPPRL